MGSVCFHKEQIDYMFVLSQVCRFPGGKYTCRLCGNTVYNNDHEVVLRSDSNRDSFMIMHHACAEKLMGALGRSIVKTDLSIKAPKENVRINHETGKDENRL